MHFYIVGTHHKHQFGRCNTFEPAQQAYDEFATYLKEQCEMLHIQTIAEEMCSDGREKWEIKQTAPDVAAEQVGIEHMDCDPDENERDKLGIVNDGIVRMNGLMYDHSKETIERNIRAEYDKREQEWIRRLGLPKHERVLLVCGFDHSRSLAQKTTEYGWHTSIIIEEWTPNN